MALTFDATLKDLAREHPLGFLAAFDGPASGPVSLLNVDLSTISKQADLVIGLGDPLHEIIHFDFQASADANKHMDILVYNVLLHRHDRIPVHSILVLLRPQAIHKNMDGIVSYAARPKRGKMDFSYEVVRLWEIPAEVLLAGDLGIVPLAPLGQLAENVSLEEGLAHVIQRLVDRLTKEAQPDQVKNLLTSAFLLSGLRVRRDVAYQLFKGVGTMYESDTFMAIIDEGKEKEAKELIFLLGQKKFGSVDESTKSKLSAITDIDTLEKLAERILDVSSWQELMD